MNGKNLTVIVSRFFMALALVASLSAHSVAQSRPTSDDSARSKEREAFIAKLRQRQDDTSAAKTGWLILEGRFVEPPYNIEVTDSSVTVNGMDVFVSKAKSKQNSVKETDSSGTGINASVHATIQKLLHNYKAQRETIGVSAARENALAFLRQQEYIDTAYFRTESIIRFRKSGDKYGEDIPLRSKPFVLPQDAAENNQKKLRVYANRLIITLREGALVIRENGRGPAISYPESETALNQLREAAATIPDFEERKKRIQEIIGKEKFAEKIAREFR